MAGEILNWVTEQELRDLGFAPTGPEHDLGQRWGEGETVRITFAPCGADEFGYLYAYDSSIDRYAMLTSNTTLDVAVAAYADATCGRPIPDGYLALSEVLAPDQNFSLRDVRELWLRCAGQEAAARLRYERLPIDAPDRFTVAHEFVVARGARVAAEDIMISSLERGRCLMNEPVIVIYRIAGRNDWTGRVAAFDVEEAAFRVADLTKIARSVGYEVQATQLVHGPNCVPATQIQDLQAFAHRPGMGPSAGIEF